MDCIIELVGKKHQDRLLDDSDYLGGQYHVEKLRLAGYSWAQEENCDSNRTCCLLFYLHTVSK